MWQKPLLKAMSKHTNIPQKCNLGHKGPMLCWSDGRTQLMLDFSLHGERGKVEEKEQGLTSEQKNRRYECKHDGYNRIAHMSFVMIRYHMLASIKSTLVYENIG